MSGWHVLSWVRNSILFRIFQLFSTYKDGYLHLDNSQTKIFLLLCRRLTHGPYNPGGGSHLSVAAPPAGSAAPVRRNPAAPQPGKRKRARWDPWFSGGQDRIGSWEQNIIARQMVPAHHAFVVNVPNIVPHEHKLWRTTRPVGSLMLPRSDKTSYFMD